MSGRRGGQRDGQAGGRSRFREARRIWRGDAWVRPYLRRYKKALAVSLLLGMLVGVFAVGLMAVSGYLISDAAEQPELGLFSLLVPLGLVQVFGIGRPFLGYEERLKSHDWVLRVSSALRSRLYGAVEREGVFWSTTRRAGELLGLLADDIGHVQDLYLRTVFPLVVAWALWLLAAVAFGVASPPFALIMLLALGVLCVLVPLVSALVNGARQMRAKRLSRELYARVHDDVSGLADWTFAGRPGDFAAHVEKPAETLDRERAGISRSSRGSSLVVGLVFGALSTAVLVWAAVRFAGAAQAPAASGAAGRPADMVAALVIGFFPLLEAFAPLPGAAARAGEHVESIERLNGLGAQAEPGAASTPPEPGDAGIEVRGLRFAYPGARETLRDVTLSIPAGQKLAILGPSGSGKSTLLALLRGDLVPTAGTVELGGVPTCEMGDAICPWMGFVQQDVHLFDATLYENLALGDDAVTRAGAEDALVAVGLGPLLDMLPDGLDTLAGETGLRFSGGERHRVALARVLCRDVPIVVLDEPFTALDPITENRLLDTFFEVFAECTVVMVTHHLAGIEHMDRVVFLEDGRVALDGAPGELEKTSGRYRQLLALDR